MFFIAMTIAMTTVHYFLVLHGLMGAYDTFYHHEWKERLSCKAFAWQELRFHSIRSFLYMIIFLIFALVELQGSIAFFILFLALSELIITLRDAVEEDSIRRLSMGERVIHLLLMVNYGVIAALFTPIWYQWVRKTNGIEWAYYGVTSWVLTFFAAFIGIWSIREFLASIHTRSLNA